MIRENYTHIITQAIKEVISVHPDFKKDEHWKKWYFENNLDKRTELLKLILNLPGIRDISAQKRSEFKILDIGPAEGIIPRALKIMGFDVYVLEHKLLSPEIDKISFYKNLKLKECCIEKGNFPFEDNYFDLVFSFGVMEHIEPPTSIFWEENKRILNEGGHVFIDNPQSMNLRKRIWMIFGINPNNEIAGWYNQKPIFTGHFREHTLSELEYCMQETGLTIVSSGAFQFIARGYIGETKSKIKKILIRLYMLLCLTSNNLKDTVYVFGRKN